ncbi:hypothetical protein CYMTET_31239 [Cymbomonas tetramitiformis]|uniref:Uncharacterized protein n=1 Tax=Cymbomonas tetramitiformis TaxID=36881 RepID=A0AAE0FHI3_9CHLO|nr:hypothetical protein CYMTET_31239 [Cymbomonas tetramitiformis]
MPLEFFLAESVLLTTALWGTQENILRGVFSLPESVLLTTDLLALVRAAPRMNPGVKTARELVAMYATMVQAHAHQALALSFARPLVQDTPNDLGTSMPWQEKHFVQLQLVRINCNRPPKGIGRQWGRKTGVTKLMGR